VRLTPKIHFLMYVRECSCNGGDLLCAHMSDDCAHLIFAYLPSLCDVHVSHLLSAELNILNQRNVLVTLHDKLSALRALARDGCTLAKLGDRLEGTHCCLPVIA
jgi:hypothetical protein